MQNEGMQNSLIKNGAVIADDWQLLRDIPETGLPTGKLIVPATYWLEHRDSLRARGDVAVWLGSDQAPALIAEDLSALPLVAIDFPIFTDGRGFSYGRTLREQYGYQGEVRAIGEFIRDQLHYLSRCGFDAYALTTSDPVAAVASLNDFSDGYQASINQSQPHFRRR
ncbi:MAG: DUF934 domain-containing protein [Spongiibacteraceae bacterium]